MPSIDAQHALAFTNEDFRGGDDSGYGHTVDPLALRQTITELVAIYQQSEQDIREAFGVLAAVETRLSAAFQLGSHNTFRVNGRGGRSRTRYEDPDEAIGELQRQVWVTLVERLDIRRLMSVKAWEKLQRELECGELPAISEENVFGMVRGFLENIPDMLTDAVQEVFEWLRPRGSRYKTNSEYEVGKKVILPHCVESRWSGAGFEVHFHREQNLTALENVFSALDGQGAINKAHRSQLSDAIKLSGTKGAGETTYFRFRCCKNQNLHLEFKRTDLLQQFNAIAGGNRLRAQ